MQVVDHVLTINTQLNKPIDMKTLMLMQHTPGVMGVELLGSDINTSSARGLFSFVEKTPSIKMLKLVLSDIKELGARNALVDAIRNSPHVEHLHLNFGTMRKHRFSAIASAIRDSVTIKKLTINVRPATKLICKDIGRIVSGNASITDLWVLHDDLGAALEGNTTVTSFTIDDVSCSTILLCRNLTKLHISTVKMTVDIAGYLARYIESSEHLVDLAFVFCDIREEHAQFLAPAISTNTRLVSLILSDFEFMTGLSRTSAQRVNMHHLRSIKALPAFIENSPNIVHLDISYCQIFEEQDAERLAEAVNNCTTIERFYLGGYSVYPLCVSAIVRALINNATIKKIQFPCMAWYDNDDVSPFYDFLMNNKSAEYVDTGLRRREEDAGIFEGAIANNHVITELIPFNAEFVDILERNKHNKTQKAVTLFDTYKHALDHQEPCSSSFFSKRLRVG